MNRFFPWWNFQVHYNILDLNPRVLNSITHLLSTIGLNWAWLILSNPWWDIVGGGGSDDAAAAVAVAVGVGGPVAAVQFVLCEKPSFLYQLIKNLTIVCSLNYKFSTCFAHQIVLLLFWPSEQFDRRNIFILVLKVIFNKQFVVIFWVSWCKNEGFWQRITCKRWWRVVHVVVIRLVVMIMFFKAL